MTADVVAWLDGRRPAAPAPLRAAVLRALAAGRDAGGRTAAPREHGAAGAAAGSPGLATDGIPEALARAALRTLKRVIDGAGGRGSAADLLAADALLTYACEAAAEAGPEALRALTDALGPGTFDALLGSDAE